ncbi:hypothetical protein PtA15_3A193 [Puccinia triticina]|uniref:CxC1-like cysteine cluster associated with KDZ transposases domain-containing protein n=1 Tax=Puccinia triticina TaxID=208348 RepID=A0ABY7CCB6_9BASI|nr:uncharacterized protein PtA15_3A193 [Puccinia triticina]WAQ82829.1 hypothetical protein PtA15_3A193 [Puccinia triticina]
MARTRYNSDRPETYARFRAGRNSYNQRQQLHHGQEEFCHENILDNPYNHPQEEDTSDDEENDNDERNWVVLTEEEPVNPIDAAIKARKAQHRQQARQYDYLAMIQSLHSVYLVLKYKTNDWTGSNTFYDFRNCNCLPHTKTSRPVDLVDVSVYWLCRKFGNAVKRRRETRSLLAALLGLPNPHKRNGRKYTEGYFLKQWRKQREFQTAHTQEEDDRTQELVQLYKDEAALEHLRKRLQGPEIFLATEEELRVLLDQIVDKTEQLKRKAEALNRGNSTDQSAEKLEEERLLLLLWDAKSDLFVQAVHLRAEREPILNSKNMGTRLGTKLKEKIYKSIAARRPAVVKLINYFNSCHANRIQEEFQLISQELSRAVGWAISQNNLLRSNIRYIHALYLSSETDDTRPPDEHIDSLPMAGMTYRQKLKCINQELRLRLSTHKVLVQDRSDDVMWLWDKCQPPQNKPNISEWIRLAECSRSDAGVNLEVPDIDEELEDVLLDNEGDDGDYDEDDWVDEIGYDDTPEVAPPLPAKVAPPLPQESEARISSPVPEELNVPDRSAPSIPE